MVTARAPSAGCSDRAGPTAESCEGLSGRSPEAPGPVAAGLGGPICPPWRLVRRSLEDLRLPADAPRAELGDLDALRESVARHGLLVPLLIEPDGTVRAGARRLAALRALGRQDAECLLLPPGAQPGVVQLVENLQRKGLAPVEEARAMRALLDATGWSQARLARELGVSPARVSLSLNLLAAPPEVQAQVDSGDSSAYAVASAFGRRGRADGRAERVAARIREGRPVRAGFAPASARVSARELPRGIRARAFADRVEITFTVWDESAGLEGLMSLVEAFRSALGDREAACISALRKARARLAELDDPG